MVNIINDNDDQFRRLLAESARTMFPGLTLTDDQAVVLSMRELICFMRYSGDPRLHEANDEQRIDDLTGALRDFSRILLRVQQRGLPEYQWRYMMGQPSLLEN